VGLVSAWALPLAGLILCLAALTVLIERERQLEQADPVEPRRPVLPAASPGTSTALVAYRPPGALVPWKPR
jgi:hypothetical protein